MGTLAVGFPNKPAPPQKTIRLFLCGDVMTGRGIDQILSAPCDPRLHENFVHSAVDYVRLAERINGPIPRQAGPDYIWGAALSELERRQPDVRMINLETAITRSEDFARKGINYRMSPENAECLRSAQIDCCTLANNHVLDWGRKGLLDTLTTLHRLGIKSAGAGRNLSEAASPAILNIPGKARVVAFAFACQDSGTPRSWAATTDAAGVNFLSEVSKTTADRASEQIRRFRQLDDIVVVSIHWGPNWGYEISEDQRQFAHALIEQADVSIVHGHSSHHAKAIEVHRNRLILYGCGDFLNDYEGIQGYEEYRDDLALMYLADIDITSRCLVALEIVPFRICKFQLVHPSAADVQWVRQTLDRECRRYEAIIAQHSERSLALFWQRDDCQLPSDIETDRRVIERKHNV